MSDPQKMRYNDTELGLFKALFAGDDRLLFIIRKVMFQFDLTEEEQNVLRSAMNETTNALFYKTFLPTLDPTAPLFQVVDLVIGLRDEMKTNGPDEAWPFIKAKEMEINYILQQLKALTNPEEKPEIIFSELSELGGIKTQREAIFIRVTARNYLVSFIDSVCNQMRFLAGIKEESVEETKERLAKNSNK